MYPDPVPLQWTSDQVAFRRRTEPGNHGTTNAMNEIHCHRHGHSAGAHVISSRAHLSVKPDTSMIVAYPTFSTTVFQTNGFWTTHQRPRGATS